MKKTCIDCKRNFKMVCKSGRCCNCEYEHNGRKEWPVEFSEHKK